MVGWVALRSVARRPCRTGQRTVVVAEFRLKRRISAQSEAIGRPFRATGLNRNCSVVCVMLAGYGVSDARHARRALRELMDNSCQSPTLDTLREDEAEAYDDEAVWLMTHAEVVALKV